MPIDTYEDPQLAAVAALVVAAARSDLHSRVISGAYEDPRDLSDLNNTELPALSVYRASEDNEQRHSGELVSKVTIRFEYVLADVHKDRRGDQWPTLVKVWRSIVKAVTAGSHAAASGGALVLDIACVDVQPTYRRHVQYGFAKYGGKTFPSFRGDIVADFYPLDGVATATLDDFLAHVTVWAQPGDTDNSALTGAVDTPPLDPPDDDYLADDATTLPAYGS